MSKLTKTEIKEANAELINLIKMGLSAQAISAKLGVDLGIVADFMAQASNEIKNSAPDQRVILRQIFRDNITFSLQAMKKIASGQFEDTPEELSKTALQLRAAESILKHASKFVDEDLLTGWYERPLLNDKRQTIFEFGAEIDATGATVHYIKESEEEKEGDNDNA